MKKITGLLLIVQYAKVMKLRGETFETSICVYNIETLIIVVKRKNMHF